MCNVVDKVFGILPAQTWVGNGFAVNTFVDFLAALFQITFNHKSFYQTADISV